MRVSVVVNTHNRAASLGTLLEALEMQTHPDFEVVVVNGPSTDGTTALLERLADRVRVASCSERNLSKSRNIGIDNAAGDVVAFIDDDAVPEPTWLEELVAGYADGTVAGVGGLVLDPSGVRYQYRYSLCDRLGETTFPMQPPPPKATLPGADPFVYLQGTNASFLRSALVEVQGFDEELAYMYDESELCAILIDAGYRLRALDGAVVHHKFLPSHLRTTVGFTDPFHAVKNRAYLALRLGRSRGTEAEIIDAQQRPIAETVSWAQHSHRNGGLTAPEVARYVRRAEEGLTAGIRRGLEGNRLGRPIAPPSAEAFLPYPRRRAQDAARIVFTSQDYPPKAMGGIARFTTDLARAMAARGHDVHVVTRDDGKPARVDVEDGVWVHRYRVGHRFLPELEGSAVVPGLEQSAAIHSVVERIAERGAVDVVCGPLWGAETLVCTLDTNLRVVTTCMTPLQVVASMQERVGRLASTDAMIALESAVLRRSSRLVPVSAANGRTVAELAGDGLRPATVLHHGVADRRSEFPRERQDDAVELLFVGRLEARKGVDVLLRAAVGVLRRHAEARLRLVGEDNAAWSAGEDWGELLQELSGGDRSILARVDFAGRVTEEALLQAFADADVFVAPSRYESFGLVVAEAMMMGLPVVSTDVGGIPEVAQDGKTALLVPPGDPEALSAALERLVVDAGLRQALGAAGRARFEAVFDNEVVVERYLEVLLAEEEATDALPAVAAGAELLDELVGVRGSAADDAAAALLDGARHPVDLAFALENLGGSETAPLVARALEAVMGRPASAEAVEEAAAELPPFPPLRSAARRAFDVAGLETELLPSALDGLPDRRPADVVAALRRTWVRTGETAFLDGLLDALAVAGDAELWERAQQALTESRLLALDVLLATPRVRRRIGTLPRADELSLLEAADYRRALEAIAQAPLGLAIERAFVLVVGRASDPVGRRSAMYQALRGTRAEMLKGLASTDSALAYGTDPEAFGRFVDEVPGLANPARARRLRARGSVQRLEVRVRELVRGLDQVSQIGPILEAQAVAAGQMAAVEQAAAAIAAQGEATLEAVVGEQAARLEAIEEALVTIRREVEWSAAAQRSELPTLGDCAGVLAREGQEATQRVDDRVALLAAKYEALSLDLRERLAPEIFEELMDPEVLDPAALEPGARVNLGCGEKPLPGYVNVDFRKLPGVAVVADVRRLPFASRSLNEIASHHLVEHFRQTHLEQVVLPGWRELLADDGVLRVVTPNLDVLTEWYRTGRLTPKDFKTVLFGLQDYAGDDHYALYTPGSLTQVLKRARFERIEVLEADRPNGNSPELEVVARPARP